MRWPLRNQILLPMICLMLGTLLGMSAMNAYFSVRRTRVQIECDLQQVAETLANPGFPLNDFVLRKMRGLSGAEFVLTDRRGTVLASSAQRDALVDLPERRLGDAGNSPALGTPIVVGDRHFFHAPVKITRTASAESGLMLHILYPKEAYDEAWRLAVYPPLLLGVVAVVLAVVIGRGIAGRVTRPLRALQVQVDEIARGSFERLSVPQRDDEVADLSRCINQMSDMLARYEAEVRRNEQLRTLGQLGGGIAHQMRNSVTGCRLAVELHARKCRLGDDSLDVAEHQLELMEKHLQRFLALGRRDDRPHVQTNLAQVVDNVVSLVGPSARHCGVKLKCDLPERPLLVCGDRDALEQLLTNVTLNAIEAASRIDESDPDSARSMDRGAVREETFAPQVDVALRTLGQQVRIEVQDTGAGPSPGMERCLFEPFVTDKPDGTGLGLSVARDIAFSHGGEIRWERRGAKTCFVVELPIFDTEQDRVETPDC
jgi:signal transduction histidine kinase